MAMVPIPPPERVNSGAFDRHQFIRFYLYFKIFSMYGLRCRFQAPVSDRLARIRGDQLQILN
jgi:hypothetical protein